MNRGYSREWYLERVKSIREILGDDCGLSSDMITGFCSETEDEHHDTLTLMDLVQFDYSYMFHYSERPGTLAAKKLPDDIPLEVKKRRLDEIIKKQSALSVNRNRLDVGKVVEVLVEGPSRKSSDYLQGRNSQNKVVIFPKENKMKGQYVHVLIERCTQGTLIGKIVN
jgi:tRNA-2-methylthio-N6-dimethylallyladenosine synthase